MFIYAIKSLPCQPPSTWQMHAGRGTSVDVRTSHHPSFPHRGATRGGLSLTNTGQDSWAHAGQLRSQTSLTTVTASSKVKGHRNTAHVLASREITFNSATDIQSYPSPGTLLSPPTNYQLAAHFISHRLLSDLSLPKNG